jgi:D-tyrosyl-tRNA(Tyr) deacylase
MKAVIQRVGYASVVIEGKIKSGIDSGLLILIGIAETDEEEDARFLAAKIPKLRIFNDLNNQMNLSNTDTGGDYLVISQFTLIADTQKGNRPSYIKAARPEKAIPLYEKFVQLLEIEAGKKIMTGEFGADMKVSLVNEGPVTIIMDSKV